MKVKNKLSFYVLSLLAVVFFAIGANFLIHGFSFKNDSSSSTSITRVDDTVKAAYNGEYATDWTVIGPSYSYPFSEGPYTGGNGYLYIGAYWFSSFPGLIF